MRVKTLVFIAALLLLFTPTLWANDSASVAVTLELLEVNENDRISVSLKFTLKNESTEPVEVLKWGTPFEGEFTRDSFDITVNGEKVAYIGKLVKRLPPAAEDYITIQGNSELSKIVYLEDGYKIYAPGFYSAQFSPEMLRIKTASQAMKLAAAQSGEVEFEIAYGISEDAAAELAIPKSKCSSSQFNTVQSAHGAAKSIAAVAKQALNNAPVSKRAQAQRYQEWFGTYTESRYSRVAANFDKIHDVLFNETITAECPGNCGNVYAYVYPSQPYVIYFCGAFFRAPLTGTDSKAGTIIHEVSHFDVVAGTDDVVYGQSGARNLAQTNPDAAVRNADSHEYFAENTPPLSMPTGGGGGGGGSVDSTESGSGCFVQSIRLQNTKHSLR